MKKKLFASLLALSLILTACGGKGGNQSGSGEDTSAQTSDATSAANADDDKVIKFGVSPVPHQELAEAVKDDLKKEGYDLQIIPFDDYVLPNKALASGDLDANFFQHDPYLKQFCQENKLDLVNVGAVHIEPLGIYSDKFKSLEELPNGARVIIPNDVTNGARALLLLEKNGLIKLDDPTNLNVTEVNVVENPKNLQFIPMEAPSIPSQYKSADAAAINSNWALGAGLNPVKDNIAIEGKDSPYANIIAVRNGDQDKPKIKALVKAFQSETIKKFIEEKYNGAVIPAF